MLNLPNWGMHAELKKARHNITEEQIADTWVYGELIQDRDKCYRLVGKDITLVLSSSGEFIITLYPNKYKDKESEERVTNSMAIGATRFDRAV